MVMVMVMGRVEMERVLVMGRVMGRVMEMGRVLVMVISLGSVCTCVYIIVGLLPHLGDDAAFDRRSRETSRGLGIFPEIWLTAIVYLSQVHPTNTPPHYHVFTVIPPHVAESCSCVGRVDTSRN
jgi:hypothetical protein